MTPPICRTVYSGRTRLLPELTVAGWDRFVRAGPLPEHVHDNAFEICFIVSGSVDWFAGDDLSEVRGGDLYLTRPGERHGGVDAVMNPCELYWFHIVIPTHKPLPGMTRVQTQRIRQRLVALRLRAFRASATSSDACHRLYAEHARADDLASEAARATLHTLLVQVLRDHDAALARERVISDPVRRVMRYILEHLSEPLRIADVSAKCGISVGRLHARFIAETGQTPGDWRLRQLITRAKSMLRSSNRAVTDIALDLGFSSSQYFATAFKRVTGVTPVSYRNAAGTDSSLR